MNDGHEQSEGVPILPVFDEQAWQRRDTTFAALDIEVPNSRVDLSRLPLQVLANRNEFDDTVYLVSIRHGFLDQELHDLLWGACNRASQALPGDRFDVDADWRLGDDAHRDPDNELHLLHALGRIRREYTAFLDEGSHASARRHAMLHQQLEDVRAAARTIIYVERQPGLPDPSSGLGDAFFTDGYYDTFDVTHPDSAISRPLYGYLALKLGLGELPITINHQDTKAGSDPMLAFILHNRGLFPQERIDMFAQYRQMLDEEGRRRLDDLDAHIEAGEQARFDAQDTVHKCFMGLPKEQRYALLTEYWETLSEEQQEAYLLKFTLSRQRNTAGHFRPVYDALSNRVIVPEQLAHRAFNVIGNQIVVSDGSGYSARVNIQDVLDTDADNSFQQLDATCTVPESYYGSALVPVIAWVDAADGTSRFLTETEMQMIYPTGARPNRGRLDSWLGKAAVATHAVHSVTPTMNMPTEMSLGNGKRHRNGRLATQRIGVAQVEVATEYLLHVPSVARRVLGNTMFFGKFRSLFAI